jgi:hypothetical protein
MPRSDVGGFVGGVGSTGDAIGSRQKFPGMHVVYELCCWSDPMPVVRMQLGNPIHRGASPVTLRACRLPDHLAG